MYNPDTSYEHKSTLRISPPIVAGMRACRSSDSQRDKVAPLRGDAYWTLLALLAYMYVTDRRVDRESCTATMVLYVLARQLSRAPTLS